MTTAKPWPDPVESGLVRLSLPCPPMLLEACGYRGGQRFVSLAWGGDHLWYDDGVTAGTAGCRAFLMFAWHPIVAAAMRAYDILGTDARDPAHQLLVDSVDTTLYVGTAGEVRTFLRSLIPQLSARGRAIAAEQFEAVAQRPIRPPTADEVRAAMTREAELCAALEAWLAGLARATG